MKRTALSAVSDDWIRIKTEKNRVSTVVIQGDIDFRRSPQIREAVMKLLEHGRERVGMDLSEVVFMDSSGISALVDCAKAAGKRNACVVLISPSRQLLRLLEVSGFKVLFGFQWLPVEPVAPAGGPAAQQPFHWQVSRFTVPCDPELVADIRRRIGEVAQSMPFTVEDVEDIKLAAGEASANAFRYGCPNGPSDTISVLCIGEPTGLTVEIRDHGPGFDPSRVPEPESGSLEIGGRGIFFMRLAMDEVTFARDENSTLVRMVKYLRQPRDTEPVPQ